MTNRMRCTALGIVLVMSCGSSDEAPAVVPTGSGSGAPRAARPGGGFSADLAKEFEGSGSAASGSAAPAAAKVEGAGSNSAIAKAEGSGSAAGSAAAGSAAKLVSGEKVSATEKAPEKPAEKAPEKPAEKAPEKPAEKASAPDKAAVEISTKTPAGGVLIQSGNAVKRTGAVPAELAAIKLALKPNWERDVQEPGTFSLAVKIPGSDKNAVFVFRYGYEDASAPVDRDAYKKWLADKKVLTTRQDRQAGSTWILEGTDARGAAAFRAVVNWSNKKLLCYGSLYRDAESSKLGDLRDDTIVQAKQICESVAL